LRGTVYVANFQGFREVSEIEVNTKNRDEPVPNELSKVTIKDDDSMLEPQRLHMEGKLTSTSG